MCISVSLLANHIWKMNNTFKTTYYSVQTHKQIHDLRIVFVSDLHLKEYGKDNEDLLVAIKNLKPDIIAVGGDSVIYNNKDFSSAITFLNNAAQIAPTYIAPGNHEWTLIYHYKNYKFLSALRQCEAIYLDNKLINVIIGENEFIICGAYDEPDAELGKTDKVFEKLNEIDENTFTLLLNHCPTTIKYSNVTPIADLVLSGHEHGGQFIIPFTNQGLYSNNQGFFPQYTGGMHTIANNTVIISRGLSNSYHKIPRINNQPELVVIDVNKETI